MSRILVTGGAGFIGSHLVDHLLERGQEVVVLDDLSGGCRENLDPAADFVKGSILNARRVESVFREGPVDYVCHLAAYAAEGLSHFIKRFNHRNNLIGSINLINASVNHGVRCFLFTSSMAVYGASPCPMTEDMPGAPVDSYGIAKEAVERELKITRDVFGLNYIVFRPHNVYGERQNIGDRYRNVIGIFMNQIMSGEPLTIFGDGTQKRAFTYIDDAAPVMADALFREDAWNQVYNVGADDPVPINVLASEVARAMGVEAEVRHLPPREEVKEAWCSHEKIRRVLGFRAKTSLGDGLRRMADWARRTGSRRSRRFRNIEIPRNLPDVWRE
jgi:UDP-glucose 4-epimerase